MTKLSSTNEQVILDDIVTKHYYYCKVCKRYRKCKLHSGLLLCTECYNDFEEIDRLTKPEEKKEQND